MNVAPMDFTAEAVREFEHAGWQLAAADYEASFAPATARFVEALLDAAGVAAGTRMLDFCCGTGVVTGAAARRGATATGLDFSPAMLAQARARHPAIGFERGDAEAMPFGDARFAAVVANFGIHHVPVPATALAEARRVLAPGGRIALTSWAAPDENIAWRLVFDAVRAHGDPNAAMAPPSGGNLGAPGALARLLDAAGFAETAAATVRLAWRVADAAALVAALRRGTVRTAALIAAQPERAMPAILAHIERAAAPYRDGDGLAVPIAAVLARGGKPQR